MGLCAFVGLMKYRIWIKMREILIFKMTEE